MASEPITHSINPDLPICTGYLDRTLEIFERHKHPFVLISTLALTWSGVNCCAGDEIDVLVRSSALGGIVKDLVRIGDWEHAKDSDIEELCQDLSFDMESRCDVWLRSSTQDPFFHYLRLWPETLYNLSVDCEKLEIPDVMNKGSILLEEEYYRDTHQRFGPPRGSTHPELLLPPLQTRAKLLRMDLRIYVPTIEDHLNALLYQARAEVRSGRECGNAPALLIQYFVRYLYLDWTPTRHWILNTKIHAPNREYMRSRIDKFQRKKLILWDTALGKYDFNNMPWELSIRGS
ncbi:MAG: hypothetical protein Q9170_007138 [Blastenia crenularia]